MKRGTPDHPKMEALATALGVDLAKAVGTLELLWHFTAKFAPQGDVGKWSDEAIAKAAHWCANDGEPCKLVRALVETRWLDECKERRLIVHDWGDHADDATKKQLKRKELDVLVPVRTLSRQRRKLSGHVQTTADNGGLPEPSLARAKPSLAIDSSPPDAVRTDEPPVLRFPCVGPGSQEFDLHQSKLDEYADSYPGIDVLAECRKALQWCRDNPARRKTHGGMGTFLNKWLARAQDSGAPRPGFQNAKVEIPQL